MKPYVTYRNIRKKSKLWLEEVKHYNRSSLKPKKSKSALLVIDMQNYFLEKSSPVYTCGAAAVLPNVKNLILTFRRARRPVIYTKHVHHPDGLDAGIMGWWWDGMIREGSNEGEIHRDIAPLPKEKVIQKHRYSAFYNTDLETVLRCLSVEDLVIAGTMTNMCCESTARDAYYRDYRVFFPVDATGAVDEKMHMASLLNLAYGFAVITSVSDLLKQFSG